MQARIFTCVCVYVYGYTLFVCACVFVRASVCAPLRVSACARVCVRACVVHSLTFLGYYLFYHTLLETRFREPLLIPNSCSLRLPHPLPQRRLCTDMVKSVPRQTLFLSTELHQSASPAVAIYFWHASTSAYRT